MRDLMISPYGFANRPHRVLVRRHDSHPQYERELLFSGEKPTAPSKIRQWLRKLLLPTVVGSTVGLGGAILQHWLPTPPPEVLTQPTPCIENPKFWDLSPDPLAVREFIHNSLSSLNLIDPAPMNHQYMLFRLAAPAVVSIVNPNNHHDGTGVIFTMKNGGIWSKEGWILTHLDNVQSDPNQPLKQVMVFLINGQGAPGKVVGILPDLKLAVVKIRPEQFSLAKLPAVELAPDIPEIGIPVSRIGHPNRTWWQLSAGMYSGDIREDRRLLPQCNLPDAIGLLGAPLLNLKGEIIGIQSKKAQATGDGSVFISSDRIYHRLFEIFLKTQP